MKRYLRGWTQAGESQSRKSRWPALNWKAPCCECDPGCSHMSLPTERQHWLNPESGASPAHTSPKAHPRVDGRPLRQNCGVFRSADQLRPWRSSKVVLFDSRQEATLVMSQQSKGRTDNQTPDIFPFQMLDVLISGSYSNSIPSLQPLEHFLRYARNLDCDPLSSRS